MRPMRRRTPNGALIAAALGVVIYLVIFQPWRTVPEHARSAAEGLAGSSVHVAKGAPGLVDADRVRKVIGDRAIVVAVLDDAPLTEYGGESSPGLALCRDIAELVPTNLVIVFATEPGEDYDSAYCEGPDFPAPTLVEDSVDTFAISVLAAAESAWQYRVTGTDLTPEVEEYVLAFDLEASEAYGEIPRRGPIDSVADASALVLAFLGVVSATIAVFLLLRQLGRLLTDSGLGRLSSPRRSGLNARLNRLADRIMDPACTPNAEAAREYALALADLGEAGGGTAALDKVEKRIKRIEELLL
ncbi:hypothetical protein SAXI111661_20580 [Saccharomonospora xinjiangensis]|uniref:hypothetical protein n=1 Tax=Saccharomonospora xinjiangensis TaxID=75294 RepID=UPI0010C389AD|nr:hypothetical protein [Saccharomonospora xinjiangensis]QBQ59027.1 hypothetical protein EYD13_03235 [Saccharomonospora xinjiangensis]